jgi:predicted amidohydrolase YtcJ
VKVDLVLRDVEVDGRSGSVAVAAGRITPITDRHDLDGATELDGRGGALLPGLHDHHVHLLATAAAAHSLDVSRLGARKAAELTRLVRDADHALPTDAWLRVIGYHESIAGDLDRHSLDELVPFRPTRVQDRTGARWTFNTAAVAALEMRTADFPGIERERGGQPSGRLHRGDAWLRDRLPLVAQPDLAPVGRRLAAAGVTGVTDCTAWSELGGFTVLADAVFTGALPQRVTVTGAVELVAAPLPEGLVRGPVKVILDDGAYPALDDVVAAIDVAHAAGRAVAVHTVTRTSLALAVAAFDGASRRRGDRLEHGSVVPPELDDAIRDLGLTVVTQPGFVRERGDRYLEDVEPEDLDHLYRCRSLLDAGIPVAAGSDTPYSDLDPWPAIRTATTRRTAAGRVLGPAEAVDEATALGMWLGAADDPGGPSRRIAVGEVADLVLLDRPYAELLEYPCAEAVVATIVAGRVVHHR